MNDLAKTRFDVPLNHNLASHPNSMLQTKRIALGLLAALFAGALVRVLINAHEASALQDYTAKTLERTVLITHATPGDLKRNLTLPTTLRGNTEAVIYSRSAGYLAAWHKGIGDSVKQGELLATIDSPEQDQELAQARAQREQTIARLELNQKTLARWETLSQRQSAISQQDLDEKRSLVLQGQADLAAADAKVKRLEQLQGYSRIQAPFAGIVTRRSVDVGDLISSGGKELFAITQTNPLRLSIWIPQAYANSIKVGTQVPVNLGEQTGKKLNASVDRVAGGIDVNTRARQVDLLLENPNAKLLPGAYAEVNLQLNSGINALVVPAAVLIVTDQTQRVAVVGNDNRITLRTVKLGRDLGRDVEILDGITEADTLVVSPSDQLVEGDLVKTMNWKPAVASATSAAEKNNKTEDKK